MDPGDMVPFVRASGMANAPHPDIASRAIGNASVHTAPAEVSLTTPDFSDTGNLTSSALYVYLVDG